jgi:predicted NodU family carbamoyl transferase
MDPETAVKTFLDIGLDVLVIENYVITKKWKE